MSDNDEVLFLPVERNMRENPPTVGDYEPVAHVVEKMLSEDIGAVIVVNRIGSPTGIITEKDLVERVVKMDRDIDTTLAQSVMSTPLISVEFGETTEKALEFMHENNIRRLAVMREGELAGIVTERRLLETIFQEI